jgi:hypothetical protein
MESLDAQLASLEQSISIHPTATSLSIPASISTSTSSPSISSTPSKWGAIIRIAVSGALAAALLAGFRPIWMHDISYNADDDLPQKKILWIRAAGAWIGLTVLFFAIYHFILSKYISLK